MNSPVHVVCIAIDSVMCLVLAMVTKDHSGQEVIGSHVGICIFGQIS